MRKLAWAALGAALAAQLAFARAGGGCFAADTPILMADGSERRIADVAPGDYVLSAGPDGALVKARVLSLHYLVPTELLEIRSGGSTLKVTPDHPFMLPGGSFAPISSIAVGDFLMAHSAKGLSNSRLESKSSIALEPVYNLSVEGPNTFFAGGILVHNKGGSFGGGGFSGGGSFGGFGSRSSGSSGAGFGIGDAIILNMLFGGNGGGFVLILVIIVVFAIVRGFLRGAKGMRSFASRAHESGDEVEERILDEKRAAWFQENALAVAAMCAPSDPYYDAQTMRDAATGIFKRTQAAWMARDAAALKPILSPGLVSRYEAQLRSMRAVHEINVLEGIEVTKLWIVNVRKLPNEKTFTALIQARCADYFVNEYTKAYIRGDTRPSSFQELWTFVRDPSAELGWRLAEITQSDEADKVLRRENATEDEREVKIKASSRQVAEGDEKKGEKVEELSRLDELIAGLAKSDPAWEPEALRSRAAELFTKVYMARERSDRYELSQDDVEPELLRLLIQEIEDREREGLKVEYRNFCVRSTDIVLVRNYKDNSKDEFIARIVGHARVIASKGGQVVSDQGQAMRFMEHWTFRRGPKGWRLAEIAAAAPGSFESFDEEDVPW